MALKRTRPLAVSVLLLLTVPALLTPFAGAGSHSLLTVALWNEDAEGLGAGDSFVVWAQVYEGQTPVNVSSVTFKLGLELPPVLFPVPYPGNYAGSPGLYNATVTLAPSDVATGITMLAVEVQSGPDLATSARGIILQFPGGNPFGGSSDPWTVHAGVDNLDELGLKVNPGEELVWRIDTELNGTATNAPSLTADLYVAPHVTFGETPVSLTPVSVAPGLYEIRYTVPPTLTDSREIVLQAYINEGNEAWSNGTADVWFHDTVVDFSEATNARLAGTLTVGDGAVTLQGLNVSIEIVEDEDPLHNIGWINGTTNATGQLSFNITNDGTTSLQADGWANSTLSAQRIWSMFRVRPLFLTPLPDAAQFDAIALTDASRVPWEGVQTFPYEFWDNGTLHANASVDVYVWNSRGFWDATGLTTDSRGRANVTLDLDAVPNFGFDDFIGGGANITFRAPQGTDASASDGIWWGEDEEVFMPDPTLQWLRTMTDTNVSFVSENFVLGSPFGVGAKHTGTKNTTGWDGGAVAFPGGIQGMVGDLVERYAVWTGSDFPTIAYLRGGDADEFYGCLQVPAYWPSTTYTVIGVQAPSLAALSTDEGPPTSGTFGWAEVDVGSSLAQFTPSPDTTAPAVHGVSDLAVDLGQPLDLTAFAYDNSLDFCGAANYTWSFDDPNFGVVEVYGASATVTLQSPGTITAMLTVTDFSGNFAVAPFNVTVTDVSAPLVDAGPDQAVDTGVFVNFSAQATDDDPLFPAGAAFWWTFTYNSAPVNLSGPNATFQFDIAGAYDVTLGVADASGNIGVDTLQVAVRVPDGTPPTVDAGADVTVFVGATVGFTPLVTDNDPLFPLGAVFEWSFTYNSTPVVLTTQNASFLFDIAGTYDVTLTVWDGSGNTASDLLTVTVLPPDTTAPTVGAGADQTVVAGTTVSFQGTASDDDPLFPAGSTVEWSFSYDGSVEVLTGLAANFTFVIPGTYLVSLDVFDGSGNQGTDTLTVEVLPPDTTAPTVDAGANWNVVVGTTVSFAGTATDDDPLFPAGSNVTWSFTFGGSPLTFVGYMFGHLFDVAGTYDVTLTVVDASGNVGTDTTTVTVLPPDTLAPTITAIANMEVMTDEEVTFEATATDDSADFATAGRYNWTFTHDGTAHDLSGSTATFTFTTAEVVDVALTVSDAAGNTATETFQVRVRAPDTTPPTILLASTSVTGVVGQEILLSAAASDGGNPIVTASAFEWSFTDGSTPVTLTGGSVTHTFEAAGTYEITLRVTDAVGNEATATMEVVVEEAPAPPTTIGGLDPMLMLGLIVAVVAIAGLAWAAKRGGGKGPEGSTAPPDAAKGEDEQR